MCPFSWSAPGEGLFVLFISMYCTQSRQVTPPAAPLRATEVQVPTRALKDVTKTESCDCPFISPAPSSQLIFPEWGDSECSPVLNTEKKNSSQLQQPFLWSPFDRTLWRWHSFLPGRDGSCWMEVCSVLQRLCDLGFVAIVAVIKILGNITGFWGLE